MYWNELAAGMGGLGIGLENAFNMPGTDQNPNGGGPKTTLQRLEGLVPYALVAGALYNTGGSVTVILVAAVGYVVATGKV